ncbi:MAG: DUF438 domain-containing protein [candidate division Zixibacteria bacterium]|nr:DUF438 domain-containing protein [candidate division Zixibacteria bacterium]
MSEMINNAEKRKELLKHMILQLHEGKAPQEVKTQLVRLMGKVPYAEIVEVEQELISEGLPQEEVLKLCDVHTEALKGAIDHTGAKGASVGHPVHTFKMENRALAWEIETLNKLYKAVSELKGDNDIKQIWFDLKSHFSALMDVEKHYQRKENLLFPFLEKHDITGPPSVMWGKHDQTRELLKAAMDALSQAESISVDEAKTVTELVLQPASTSIEEMIYKENEILLPMCLDKLTETEWYQIYKQSVEIGFCLYDPQAEWHPKGLKQEEAKSVDSDRIQLPSGNFNAVELQAVLNTIPFDLTFVDKDDKVRFFSQGNERIFARNRAILGRRVQHCHPPSSVHIVEKILADFKGKEQDQCAFWINMRDRFIHIEYFAMRDDNGEYLGTLEVSQDLTEKRRLEGERRLLSYDE